MKTWRIPVIWQETSMIEVEADTLAEAIEVAKDPTGIIPLPDDGIYVDDSWEVDCCDDPEFIRCAYNNDQVDDILPPEELKQVIHAYWIIESDAEMPNSMFKLVVCSACNKKANEMYKYCPNCGTPMDLKSEGRDE